MTDLIRDLERRATEAKERYKWISDQLDKIVREKELARREFDACERAMVALSDLNNSSPSPQPKHSKETTA
jgi:hypothetical protein